MTEGRHEPILDRYRKALETLTPGGSEFYGEPERCAEFVRDRLSFTVQQQKRINELVKALEAIIEHTPEMAGNTRKAEEHNARLAAVRAALTAAKGGKG